MNKLLWVSAAAYKEIIARCHYSENRLNFLIQRKMIMKVVSRDSWSTTRTCVVTSQWALVLDWCCNSDWKVYRLFQNLSTALCWRDASLDNNQEAITAFGADPCTQWWAVLTKLLSSSAHTHSDAIVCFQACILASCFCQGYFNVYIYI